MLIEVKGTTKSGREWLTQISVNSDADLILQMSDIKEQLDYERSQLL